MDTKALRQKILDLAIRGKLVPQDPNDEPASVLLERIREQKKQMVKEGKLKAKDIKNDTIIFVGEDNLHYEKFQDGTVKCIENEIPFEVPEGWEWCRLNSIATFELGKTLDTAKNTGTYKPYLRSVNVRWNSIDLNDINCMKFEPDELARYSIKKGDLLICEGGDVGRSCVWEKNEEMYYQNALHRVRFYMNINPYFYMYIMMYYANSGKLQEICKGVTIKHLTRTTLLTLLFPLPPQNESLNIINKILEFDSLLQNLEENKNDISYLISCAKSKILDLAIRGQLVPQNPDDEPASVLLERIRAEKEELIKQGKIKRDKKESIIFRGDDNSYYEKIGDEVRCIDEEIPFDIPYNWEWIRLKNICNKIIDGSHNPPKGMGNITPFIMASSRNINFDTLLDLENVRYLCQCDYEIENERTNIKTGDILLTTVATLGRSCIYNGFPKNLCFQRSVTVISTDIVPEYLKLFLDAPYFQKFIFNNATGTAQKGFYLNQLENVLVCVPPLSEQTRMLQTAEVIFKQLISIEKSLR